MIVSELIEKLKDLNPNADVYIHDARCSCCLNDLAGVRVDTYTYQGNVYQDVVLHD